MMLSLARKSSSQSTRPLLRSLAAGAHTQAKRTAPDFTGPSEAIQKEDQEHYVQLSNKRVPVNPKHGLYGFFRKKTSEKFGDQYEVVTTPEEGQMETGRAWEAAELRNKSFKDLHTLWYVALRERNLLATQKEETRRMGVANTDLQVPMGKVRACRKTMARIKYVLNERRLAYEGALKLAEKQVTDAIEKTAERIPFNIHDHKVLIFQRNQAFKARVQKAAASSAPKASAPKASPSQVSAPKSSTEQDQTPKRGRRRGQPKPNKKSRMASAQTAQTA